MSVGDRFTLLNRGSEHRHLCQDDISRDELLAQMAGGKELVDLEREIAALGGRGRGIAPQA